MIRIIVLSFYIISGFASPAENLSAATKQTGKVSEKAYQLLFRLEKLVQSNDCRTAMLNINSNNDSVHFSNYENALIRNVESYCFYLSSRQQDAIENYRKTLNDSSLPDDIIIQTAQTLGTLMLGDNRYDEGSNILRDTITRLKVKTPELHLLHAKILYFSGKHTEALFALRRTDDLLEKELSPLREQLTLTLFSVYEAIGKHEAALIQLESLVQDYTKSQYLKHLSHMYNKLGREKDQLAILNLLFDNKKLDHPHEIESLIYLSFKLKNYYRAASILSRQIKANKEWRKPKKFSFLSQTWLAAKEYDNAISAMEEACSLSDIGDYCFELARQYAILRRWEKCSQSALISIEKGLSSFQSNNANLLIGQSLYNLGQFKAARAYFVHAANSQGTANLARQWIISIDSNLKSKF